MNIHSKTVLITGASSGVGLECCKHFISLGYNVIGTARRHSEFVTDSGDLHNLNFRKSLIEKYNPDIFINNAGISKGDTNSILNLNVTAAADLLLGFYNKMKPNTHIINISSVAANINGWENMDQQYLVYKASKKLLKTISNDLTFIKDRQIRITSLEPDKIDTPMLYSKRTCTYNADSFKIDADFCPIEASYIPKVIEWIIQQPPWVVIKSLEISNANRNHI